MRTLWRTIGMAVALLLSSVLVMAQRPRSVQSKASAKTPKVKPTPVALTPSPKKLAEVAAQSREKLIEASKLYRDSLEKLLALQKQDEMRAAELVARRKQLFDLGVIARREVEESEQALAASRQKTAETNQRLDEVDQLVAEVVAAEQLAHLPPQQQMPGTTQRRVLLVRYIGRTGWTLAHDLAKVDAFFQKRFGRPLPISAYGQTETHNRLGFDHANALDVSVHPDSTEGLALQAFLRGQGISFIAIRGAIAGSATGAHIHIGLPSRRLVWTQ